MKDRPCWGITAAARRSNVSPKFADDKTIAESTWNRIPERSFLFFSFSFLFFFFKVTSAKVDRTRDFEPPRTSSRPWRVAKVCSRETNRAEVRFDRRVDERASRRRRTSNVRRSVDTEAEAENRRALPRPLPGTWRQLTRRWTIWSSGNWWSAIVASR